MANKKALPKTLYVYEEEDGDATYLVAYKDVEDCADMGMKRHVGVYQLVNTATVDTEIVVTPKKP